MALCNFRKIDIGKLEGRRKLIDTFVNSIFLYDDHLKIIYNGKEKEEAISLEELESSKISQGGQPKNTVSAVFFYCILKTPMKCHRGLFVIFSPCPTIRGTARGTTW